MMPKIDARQLEASVDIQKIDLDKRVEKLNQQTNQFKVQMSTAGQTGQIALLAAKECTLFPIVVRPTSA